MAYTYLIFSLPDLLTHSFLHPIRIYLCAQVVTHLVTLASFVGTLLHLPFNYLLIMSLCLGLTDVVTSNLSILLFLGLNLDSLEEEGEQDQNKDSGGF
ncbi:Protein DETOXIFICATION 51 [Glycine max]|nr:Protein DETOXIFICATION 51 [Glycine max]